MHNYGAQLHRAGQIISPLTLQTITIAQTLSVGGDGDPDAVFHAIQLHVFTTLQSISYVAVFLANYYVAAYSGEHNVIVWRPSVCPSVCPISILTVTQKGAACDAATVHFRPTIRTSILVRSLATKIKCDNTASIILRMSIEAHLHAPVRKFIPRHVSHSKKFDKK